MKSKLFFLTVLFLLSVTALTAQTQWVISVDGLKMRNGANFQSASIGIIPYGEEVHVLTTGQWPNPWAEIRWNGQTGWVYNPFLSDMEVEPRSAISKRSPSQDLLIGKWYTCKPFCLEEKKFVGRATLSDLYETQYDGKGSYSSGGWEYGSSGTWTMKGSQVSVEAESGSVGSEGTERFSYVSDVSFYQIRQDWLIMESMIWITREGNRYLSVSFDIKPLSKRSEEKIKAYFANFR